MKSQWFFVSWWSSYFKVFLHHLIYIHRFLVLLQFPHYRIRSEENDCYKFDSPYLYSLWQTTPILLYEIFLYFSSTHTHSSLIYPIFHPQNYRKTTLALRQFLQSSVYEMNPHEYTIQIQYVIYFSHFKKINSTLLLDLRQWSVSPFNWIQIFINNICKYQLNSSSNHDSYHDFQ